MLAYSFSWRGFVCKYIWLEVYHFITIYTTIPRAIPREVAQGNAFLPKPQCSWLPDPVPSPASRILKMINAIVEYYNKETVKDPEHN